MMWFFKNIEIDTSKIERSIKEVVELIESSEAFAWEDLSGEEVCMDLKLALERIREKKAIDLDHIDLLIAPTGAIQELAIDSGWGDAFLAHAAIFDEFKKETKLA
ncbi:hypothetical protein MLD52_20770 [Puniceicoccaceae bacterium K14]|nr:hypothetical protein [Puniceicoccaceae bacterium K14]